jgi:hypothetical protein
MPRAKVASMKLLGNSVAVDAVYYTAKAIINHLGLKGAQGKLVINREKGVFEFSV